MTFAIENPGNKYYRKALSKEILADQRACKREPQWPPARELHPKILSYYNQITTGNDSNSEFDWYKCFSKQTYTDCLTLGSQSGRHERYLFKNKIVENFDSIVLSPPSTTNTFAEQSNTAFIIGDLNFVNLPENKYDLIFCNGVLHHIINLEHLLAQINRSLKDDGIFACCEYVGESKMQWSDMKLNILGKIISEKYGELIKYDKFTKPDIQNINRRPLEAIRSQEIPNLLDHYFNPLWVKTTDFILYPGINGTNFKGQLKGYALNNEQRFNNYLDLLIKHDYQIFKQNSNMMMPNNLRGIFKKKTKTSRIKNVQPWSKNEIKYHLSSKHDQLSEKAFRRIAKAIRKCKRWCIRST